MWQNRADPLFFDPEKSFELYLCADGHKSQNNAEAHF